MDRAAFGEPLFVRTGLGRDRFKGEQSAPILSWNKMTTTWEEICVT